MCVYWCPMTHCTHCTQTHLPLPGLHSGYRSSVLYFYVEKMPEKVIKRMVQFLAHQHFRGSSYAVISTQCRDYQSLFCEVFNVSHTGVSLCSGNCMSTTVIPEWSETFWIWTNTTWMLFYHSYEGLRRSETTVSPCIFGCVHMFSPTPNKFGIKMKLCQKQWQ